jgi:hypothetical protein
MAVPQIYFVSDQTNARGRQTLAPYLPHQCSMATTGGGYFSHHGQHYQALLACDYPRQVNLHTHATRDLFAIRRDEDGLLDWSDVPRSLRKGSDPAAAPLSVLWGQERLRRVCEALLKERCEDSTEDGVQELGARRFLLTKEAFGRDTEMHHCLAVLPEVVDNARCDFVVVEVSDTGEVQCEPGVRHAVSSSGVDLDSVLRSVAHAVIDWGL